MDYGFSIPTRGPLANRDSVLALAKRGEELGFAYLAIPDHIVIPRKIDSPYPYNTQRKMVGAADGDCLEQLVLMAYLAAATSQHPAADVDHGGAAPASGIHRQGARDDRCPVAGARDRWLRRGLDGRGVQGDRRAAVRRARQGDRRVSARIQDAVDARTIPASRAVRALPRYRSSCPSRCRSRTRRCGSAARAPRRCAGPSRWAMRGIRSARIRSFRWTRPSAIRKAIGRAARRSEPRRA